MQSETAGYLISNILHLHAMQYIIYGLLHFHYLTTAMYPPLFEGIDRYMNYIVLDLEWNQAMSAKSSVFNKLPFRLRGEIIQIGAVKLDENMQPGDEFKIDIKPVFFKRMHHRVKKLTGFDKERLQGGISFEEGMALFQNWCGDDTVFLTWGYDDRGIMEQNIMLHDLDWDWIADWINLQLIYSVQTNGDNNQKALSAAMEFFEIEQTRIAHDALGDAYNTALVASRLDMENGILQYNDAQRIIADRRMQIAQASENRQRGSGDSPIERFEAFELNSRAECFENEHLSGFACPNCMKMLRSNRWVCQGDKRYMALVSCGKHGQYLIRLKLRNDEFGRWSASKLVYKADEETVAFFNAKAVQARRRRKKAARIRKPSV